MATPPPTDPGLQTFFDQWKTTGGQKKEPLTLNDIVGLLMGTARQSVTSTTASTFTGAIPSWVPKELKPFVRSGAVDPYLGVGAGGEAQFRVFMGRENSPTRQQRTIRGVDGGPPVVAKNVLTGGSSKRDKTLTAAVAKNEVFKWTQDEVADAIKKFQSAGLTGVTDFMSLKEAWGAMVDRAAGIYSVSAGKKKVTPWGVLDMYKSEQIKAGTFKDPFAPGGDNYTGGIAHIKKTVADISEGSAWAALKTQLTDQLGRDPSDEELRDFTYRMNTLAAHNPSISKTIDHYVNGQVTGSTEHVKEAGFSEGDIAQQAYQQAQHDPDWAEYQAATTYFNALQTALGPIGG